MSTMYEYFSVISSLLYGKSLITTQGVMSFKLFLDNFSSNIKVKKIIILKNKIINLIKLE